MRVSLWTRFDKFPPILCRLLARNADKGPLETVELAERSGLSATQVEAIALQLDWRGIDVPTAKRFLQACGLDFDDSKQMRRVRQRIKKRLKTKGGRFSYLKDSANYDNYFAPLMARFYGSIR